jgi:hypothetical protein
MIARRGKSADLRIGFESAEDWFEYRLLNDPRFRRRVRLEGVEPD